MDTLQSLLAGKSPNEPPEMAIIKSFVFERYQVTPQVALRGDQFVIGVPSAALAGALRPQLLELQELCGTTSRLLLRIEQPL